MYSLELTAGISGRYLRVPFLLIATSAVLFSRSISFKVSSIFLNFRAPVAEAQIK